MLIIGAALVACRHADRVDRWRATSTFEAGHDSGRCIFTNISTQRFVPVGGGGDATGFLLLRERTTTRKSFCAEVGESRTQVDAFPGFAAPSVTPIWHLDAEGGGGEIVESDRMYHLTVPGCCDVPSVDRYFSLANGRHLFDADMPLTRVHTGRRSDRYLAVEDANGVRHPPEQGSDSTFAAVVAYGDDAEPADRVVVTARDGWEYSADSIDLIVDGERSLYHEAFYPRSGRMTLSILLTQQGDAPLPIRVTIPVTRDSLIVGQTVADSGVRVRRVAVLPASDSTP